MASTVQTANATTTISLNNGDDLAVIPNVSVAVGGDSDAVDGSGDNELTVDGMLYGNNGFYDATSFGADFIIVGSQGEITGQSCGVAALGGSDSLINAGTIESGVGFGVQFGAANTISNSGTIVGFDYAIADQGGDAISNTGLIESQFDQDSTIAESAGANSITNSGTIAGDGVANTINLDGGNDTIWNSGTIEGGVNGIYMNGGADNVTNSGTISATSVALRFVGAGSTLSDSGEIDGDVLFDGGNTGVVDVTIAHGGELSATPGNAALTITSGAYNVKNSGEITSPETSVGVSGLNGIDLGGAGAISNHGVIDAANDGVDNSDATSGDQSVLHNYGTISGGQNGVVDTGGHSDEIYNYGHIDSGPNGDAIYADANSYDDIFNRGSISGAAQLGLGGSGLVNSGTIDGEVELASWGAIINSGEINQIFFASRGAITNSGEINQIIFAGAGSGASLKNSGVIDSTVIAADARFVLDNLGTIDGSATLNGQGSRLFNSGEIVGGVAFGVGRETFTNNGTAIGNVRFAGTGNVYDGANGSVSGRIIASGTWGTYIGGAGADTFVFTVAALRASDAVEGGGGAAADTLQFSTAGTIFAAALANVSGIETIDLANGKNSITLTNALVNSANGATLTVNGGTGADTISAGAVSTATDNVVIDGGGGADTIVAGAAIDTFVYKRASDSTGPTYDTISAVNFGHDFFEVPGGPGAIATINPAVSGSLSTATFNADLAGALTAGKLGAHDAVLFTAAGGTLAGDTFLVVDLNGHAGYQANADLVVRLTGATGMLTAANFA